MTYTHLFLDYETFSLVDLTVVGLDNYAKHPSTGISMLAWALDNEEVEVWLPHCEPLPPKLLEALRNPTIIKIAWNSSFEYTITKYVLHRSGRGKELGPFDIPMSEFRDPIVLAHNLSLPGKLDAVAQILHMKNQKDPRGDELKFMFCEPVSKGGEMTLFGIAPPLFRDYVSHPREFAEYIEYCKQDVRAERDLWYRTVRVPFPERDWQGWLLDQKINAFGMPGRRDLAEKGLRLALKFMELQRALLKEKTGLANPNSDQQMKEWVTARGYPWNSLRAPTVKAEIDNPASPITEECREVLKIRSSARKSSYTKIEKFLALMSTDDDRLRNQFRYMGAARTGRWASGGGEDASMQVQNLPRGEKAVKKKLELALALLDREDYDGIVREFTNTKNPKDSITVVEFVITLLRSLFQAKPGKTFHVADKNAIENRVLGWASGCDAILDVFRHTKEDGGDPYLAFDCKLRGITYAEAWHMYHDLKQEEARQNAKPAVLGAGYGLGGGEMFKNEYGDEVRGGLWGYAKAVCGVDMPKELAHKAVKVFRDAYPEVVQFWFDLEEAFKQVFKRGGVIKVGEVTWDRHAKEWVEHPTQGKQCVITFTRKKMEDGGYMIRMELPSGRALHYLNVSLEEETRTSKKTGLPYTVQTLYYDGVEHSATQGADGQNVKRGHKWGRVKTYGGKLCLSGATQTITPYGLKRLDEISLDDLVWDGVQWVSHNGLVYNGLRETQTWMGLTGTPDHQILGGNEWHELGETTNQNGLCSLLTGLASAIRLWCSQNRENTGVPECAAIVDKSLMWLHEPFVETKSLTARAAAAKTGKQVEQNALDTISSLIENCGIYGYENFPTSSLAVTIQNAKPMPIMGVEELSVMNRGEKVEVSGLNMPSLFQDGITLLLNLIELTTMEIMNRGISGSFLEKRIQIISELLSGLPWVPNSSHTKCFVNDILRSGARTLSTIISSAGAPLNGVSTDTNKQKVYDLRNCGPRHRFMVLTDVGPIIVHNCENVVQAISRDDLLNSMILADEMGFHIVGMFHDELLCEEDDVWDGLRLEDLIYCMTVVPDWAPGLLIGAEGFTDKVYHK